MLKLPGGQIISQTGNILVRVVIRLMDVSNFFVSYRRVTLRQN